MPSFKGSSQPRDQTQVSCIAGGFFTPEPPEYNLGVAAAASAKSLQLCPTLCDPIDGSPSLGFSGQEQWSGLPFSSPVHESEKRK